jgi:two-component system, NtrC family, response regulator HydG
MSKRVLIIDDDRDICLLLSRFLSKQGYETDTAYTGGSGLAKFKENNFDAVLCDYRLGDKNGKDVLTEIKSINSEAIVIIITGYTHIKTAVDVIKAGAYDYIAKPLITDEVLTVLSSALSTCHQKVKQEGIYTASKNKKLVSPATFGGDYVIGHSKVISEMYNQISMIAPTDYNVIIHGETGTGKEVIARTIHEKSKRSKQNFVAIDCGAISKELSGSTLFGHVKGAFTGAIFDKEGYFESANNGTVFLDEVTNLSYEIQVTLLRVIQERKLKKVGGSKEIELDIRIIVASNENLQEATMNGKFREDLYHRFNEFTINLPALRNRKEDIPLFADFFLEKSNKELNKKVDDFDKEVMDIFMKYPWPGNLREFRNVIRRAVLLSKSNYISTSCLPIEIINPIAFPKKAVFTPSLPELPEKKDFILKDAACRAEYETIMNVLKEVNFNKSRAAELLNIDRKTLYNKIRNFEGMQ